MSEVIAWLAYATLLSSMFALAAWIGERGLRAAGLPTRLAPALALLGSLFVPLGAYLYEPPEQSVAAPVFALQPIVIAPSSPESSGVPLDAVIVALWVLASALLFGAVALSAYRLRVSGRRWRAAQVDGVAVWLTRDLGPAVVGVNPGRIVLPEWALQLDAQLRALLLRHEQEHLRAGDARLLLAALGAVAVTPWNPVAWWLFLRLRYTVELDCDRRVLAAGGDPHAYGTLLLEVGRLRGRGALVVGFGEPKRFLEDRIRAVLKPWRRSVLRAAALLCAGLLVLGSTFCTHDPTASANPLERTHDVSGAPSFTPFTAKPDLLNREEVARALVRTYPEDLRAAGIGGRAHVWIFVDADGTVSNVQLAETSDNDALDAAALEVARTFRMSPARNGDEPVPVWIKIPVVFSTDGVRPTPARAAAAAEPSATETEETQPPSFTPFTKKPELTNRAEIAEAFTREYPPLLKSAGIGGRAMVWLFIDEGGTVTRTQLHGTSGHDALDQAALRIAATMKFKAAENEGAPAAVWISIPVVFSPSTEP